ncbi:hypothetical protein [Pedobacter nutrimenti]|uniref:hypothetical protein n=1 Tax=Pedobacter nutrimenti TaxID=1241337 RepID=UPI00293155E1|nr:hypothetical protein [Pedobacter nutrimenti]
MKKLFINAAIILTCNIAYCQQNLLPASGKVGIGTITPVSQLEVLSPAAVGGESLMKFKVSDAANDYMEVLNSTGGTNMFMPAIKGAVNSSNTTSLYFLGETNSVNDIGTNPMIVFDSRLSSGRVNNRPLFGWDNYGTRYMTIQAGGNVGIGTTDPSAKLHINASLTESAIKIGSPNVQGNINVPVGASTGGYNLDFYTWRDIQVDQIGARIRAERINSYQPNNALVQSMDLVFSTSTGGIQTELTEKLRINSTGNVSIGTSDAKGYKLAVNGNILATEIKVQAAPWPDYVFSKNYNLPALQSIEKHIKKEGYLPDMPSAKEVESNGINVGEMNAKLLKKIEELTLYIIDQNKELLNQKDQLNNLKKDNLELKKAVFGRKR